MSLEQHTVGLVVDRSFGTRLFGLARRMHVWIVESPENRVAVRKVWDELVPRHSLEEGATMFNDDGTLPSDEVAAARLDDVDLHHGINSHTPPLSRLEIHGSEPTSLLLLALEELGFSLTGQFVGGFIAERRLDEAE